MFFEKATSLQIANISSGPQMLTIKGVLKENMIKDISKHDIRGIEQAKSPKDLLTFNELS